MFIAGSNYWNMAYGQMQHAGRPRGYRLGVDPRQMSLLGAGWTLGSLKYLAEGGALSHDLVRDGRVARRDGVGAGSPLPEQFPSRPGMVFPLFHVLADANEWPGAPSSRRLLLRPLRVDGLASPSGSGTRVAGGQPRRTSRRPSIMIRPGLTPGSAVLDEETFERATCSRVVPRRTRGNRERRPGGQLRTDPPSPSPMRIDTDEEPCQAQSETGALLSLRGIHKRFPGVQALEGVDLEVRRGEVHALVGENGAGKSTLMHILAGVYQPDGGPWNWTGTSDSPSAMSGRPSGPGSPSSSRSGASSGR